MNLKSIHSSHKVSAVTGQVYIRTISMGQTLLIYELKSKIDPLIALKFSAWHEAILLGREAALNAGKITASDWEDAKKRIKKIVSASGSRH